MRELETDSVPMASRPSFKVAITGGVFYNDKSHLFEVLDALCPTEIAHGGAPGADTLAERWHESRKVPRKLYAAQWAQLQGWAGPIRNGVILEDFRPDLLAVFPGDRGTSNCYGQAKELGIQTLIATSADVILALHAPNKVAAMLALIGRSR